VTEFFSPDATNVSRNLVIYGPSGQPANCDRQAFSDGSNGVATICNIRTSGEWRLRVLGIEGQSTGPYVVSYQLEGA